MTATAIIALITALAQAWPSFKQWMDSLVAVYVSRQVAGMSQFNRDAIKTALTEQDQRDMETAMGSTRVGEVSGNAGTIIVDSLPGVKP